MEIGPYGTLAAASITLLAGKRIVGSFRILQNLSIPEPVAGGVLIALVVWAIHSATGVQFTFASGLQAPFMLGFFASLGLGADIRSLIRGGRSVALFLVLVVGILLLQNIIGVGMVTAFGMPPAAGVLVGSVTLIGGHGTSVAWSPVLANEFGIRNAQEIALACATFGLVLGALIGGPIANMLLKHQRKRQSAAVNPQAAPASATAPVPAESTPLESEDASSIIYAVAQISVCVVLGLSIGAFFSSFRLTLPDFVWVMMTGVVLGWVLRTVTKRAPDPALSKCGDFCLGLFLSMALMSLRLWELQALAMPILAALAVQTVVAGLYAALVCYPVLGKTYDAVVLSSGFCGVALGATPTAIANMEAVTSRHGPSPLAFMVVPIVGAFFIDLVNALVIRMTLLLVGG